jgi:ABC-type transport system involved in cytochrome c biogenesis ATPase subunit
MTVNTESDGQQLKPDIAMADNGDFVVVWEDDQDENGLYQIYARGFNANGGQKFADMTVNTKSDGQQLKPAIAMAPNGDFVVVWEDDNNENRVYQIYARGFNANGSQKFADMTVNSVSTGQQYNPAVAMASNGDFVVVWEDDQDKNGLYQVYARGFNANGSQKFADKTVNSISSGQQLKPKVAMASNGDFVVVWEDDNNENQIYQIYARGFNANGSEKFADMTVNTVSSGQQYKPSVAITLD